MTSVTIEEAQSKLPELIHQLAVGEELVITEKEYPVARIVRSDETKPAERKLGTMKGTVLYMAPDFDAPLDEFKEYMK